MSDAIIGVDIAPGVALAARIHDTTLIEKAIETQLENMEVLVGLWDEAATDDNAICELEKLTGLTRRQINRWRTALNDDRRRCKCASDLLVTTYASVLGVTRCQARGGTQPQWRCPRMTSREIAAPAKADAAE